MMNPTHLTLRKSSKVTGQFGVLQHPNSWKGGIKGKIANEEYQLMLGKYMRQGLWKISHVQYHSCIYSAAFSHSLILHRVPSRKKLLGSRPEDALV